MVASDAAEPSCSWRRSENDVHEECSESYSCGFALLALDRIYERTGLLDIRNLLEKRVRTFSRREIVRALINSPDPLLMNEPSVGLDPEPASHQCVIFRQTVPRKVHRSFWANYLVTEVERRRCGADPQRLGSYYRQPRTVQG